MTFWTYLVKSLRHNRRIHMATALGVAVATAVLTGALIVGESVRGSLRDLVLDRLGRIDQIMATDRFFRQELASEFAASIQADPKLAEQFDGVVPAIIFPSATVETSASSASDIARAAGIGVFGIDDQFWKLDRHADATTKTPGLDEIVVNEPLANELKVKVGDMLTLRLPSADQVPADHPTSRTDQRTKTATELKVVGIVSTDGLGRFGLRTNQALPRNAFVAIETLQQAMDQPGRINALLLAGKSATQSAPAQLDAKLKEALRPSLNDLNLVLKPVELKYEKDGNSQTILDYYSLSTDRLLLEPELVDAVMEAWGDLRPQRISTNIAIKMEKLAANDSGKWEPVAEPKPVSYSLVSALTPDIVLGPYRASEAFGEGKIAPTDEEIVITSWMAEDQGLKAGDRVRVTTFASETERHNRYPTQSHDFTVTGIVSLTEPTRGYQRGEDPTYDQPPRQTNDPDLTPVVKGITNAEAISNWDPPFPLDNSLIRGVDDAYWENHHTTPKAYVSGHIAETLWNSRWGSWTSIRVPNRGTSAAQLEKQLLDALRTKNITLGFDLQPAKRQGLAAASGTTPFDALFMGLSMFLIAAALILIALLFRLGIEQRASEMGLLLALGWPRKRVARALLTEGLMVALAGAILGVVCGVGYALFMIEGLRSWWVGAISTPFLKAHIGLVSLVAGGLCGTLAGVLTIAWCLRAMRHTTARGLLAGSFATATNNVGRPGMWSSLAIVVLFLAAAGLAGLATRLGGEAQAGAFMGAGAAVLAALALIMRRVLLAGADGIALVGKAPLARMASRNAGRNPSRSLMTVILMAMSVFLLVAIGAFRLDPSERGSGGFDWVGESSAPIIEPLTTNIPEEALQGERKPLIVGFRVKPGDDASCRNLYQSTRPRILGVPDELGEHYQSGEVKPEFEFAGMMSIETKGDKPKTPWDLLRLPAKDFGDSVPCLLDKNTAMYSMKLYGGPGEKFNIEFEDGRKVTFIVAGLLSNSVLQGSVLIGEENFKQLFPIEGGAAYFLVRSPKPNDDTLAKALESQWSDSGLDLRRSTDVLKELLAVQNTYLSTFQTLGALGLLLGTVGLAAAQVRSVLERRGELALLRAVGFAKNRVAKMVLLENLVLLAAGLAMGSFAALVAVLPHMFLGGAKPPWFELSALLCGVGIVGLITGRWAMRATLDAPVVAALRGE
jgi:putative ABC transport system permease protein